jgi:hypothetical protein
MLRRGAWGVLMLALLCQPAVAQDGLRSGSLPEGGPGSPFVAEPQDLYRVVPDFYRQRPDPTANRLFFPFPGGGVPGPYWPYWPYPFPIDGYYGPLVQHAYGARRDAGRFGPPYGDFAEPPRETTPAAPPSPPPLPGKPKTFYVIPGCYAGDRPPQPDRLPKGCDRSRMRVIPPA